MSFRVAIQSAPIRQGTTGTPSAWAGASASTPTFSGTYDGSVSRTYTFTVVTAGTIGTTVTIEIDWDDALGSTGRLHLGTDHSYTGGDVVTVAHGISVAFTTAAVVLADTFTVVANAANRLSGSPVVVSGDALPTDVQIIGHELADIDIANLSFDGRESRVERATTGTVTLLTDYLDDANMDKLRHLHSSRSPVCIGENFDETTVFLMHGGGLLPMIGQAAAFSRSGNATYQDPRTGLLRAAPDATPRVVGGKAGRAILQEAATTNLCTQSSAKSGAGFLVLSGGASFTFDTTVKGPFEPTDPYWDPDFTAGTSRIYFTAAGDRWDTPDVAISAAGLTPLSGSVWMKGRGEVTFQLRTGIGTVATSTVIEDSAVFNLTSEWVRYELSSVPVAGQDVADIRVVASETGICYSWGWQVEERPFVSQLVQTNGGTASRSADTMTFKGPIPPSQGTLSFWFYWPGPENIDNANYQIINATGVTGTERFRWQYAHTTLGVTTFYVSVGAFVFHLGGPLVWRTWYHFAITWTKSATPGSLDLQMYLNGVPFGTLTALAGWGAFFGTGFEFSPGVPIEEVRIDRGAKTATEVAELYDRLTDEAWLHLHRAHAGRKYRIASMRPSWLHTSQPDKIVMEVTLTEMDREDDSVVVPV